MLSLVLSACQLLPYYDLINSNGHHSRTLQGVSHVASNAHSIIHAALLLLGNNTRTPQGVSHVPGYKLTSSNGRLGARKNNI